MHVFLSDIGIVMPDRGQFCSRPGCSRVASSKVHRYTQEQGWVEDLLDLTMGRYGHGCAAFTMKEEQVKTFFIGKPKILSSIFQIYLVAGGCRQWHNEYLYEHCIEYLASTEVYQGGQWITVEPLPVAVMGVRGATLDNTVFMTGKSSLQTIIYTYISFVEGGQDSKYDHHPEIWRYSAESGSWTPLIYMRTERSYHAVSVVNYHDYCE